MTIYEQLKALGVPLDSHASDLYAKVTPESRALVDVRNATGQHARPTMFRSNIDGTLWYDIPFAFDPFWDAVARKAAR